MARLCSQPGVVLLLRVCVSVCVLRGMSLCIIVLSLAFNQCLGQPETSNNNMGTGSSHFACVAAGKLAVRSCRHYLCLRRGTFYTKCITICTGSGYDAPASHDGGWGDATAPALVSWASEGGWAEPTVLPLAPLFGYFKSRRTCWLRLLRLLGPVGRWTLSTLSPSRRATACERCGSLVASASASRTIAKALQVAGPGTTPLDCNREGIDEAREIS